MSAHQVYNVSATDPGLHSSFEKTLTGTPETVFDQLQAVLKEAKAGGYTSLFVKLGSTTPFWAGRQPGDDWLIKRNWLTMTAV